MNIKHSLACKGKTGTWKRTEKDKQEMSKRLKGRVFSSEHKKNLTIALKKRWLEGQITPVIKHGYTGTRTYASWQDMKKRCLNKNNKHYSSYGGRGITICKRWVNSFENFLADIGECPNTQMSLDRINVNKGYTPKNCRWTTNKIQANNKRNSVSFKGECASDASIRLGSKNRCLVTGRLFNGWSIEKAFTVPARNINYPIKK